MSQQKVSPSQIYKTFYSKTNFRTFLTNLSTSASVRELFIQSIISTGYSHCYLEFPAITKDSLDSDDVAEYTVSESPNFAAADWTVFGDKLKPYIKKNQTVDQKIEATYFPNISGDAMLVVPVPTTDSGIDRYSGDLMTFLKHGQKSQQHDLVQLFAKTALSLIETRQKIYISTHGHGVSWLHVRLSNSPKYYTHRKYLRQ